MPKEYEDRYSFIKDDDRRKYLGMVTLLDDVIGNLTTKLDDLGLLENTLIFFISDNGGAVYSSGYTLIIYIVLQSLFRSYCL